MKKPLVLIIAASDSDLPVVIEAAKVLDQFDITYELTISSAHRSPERTISLAQKAYANGIKIIIAGASLAAHLAGSLAAHFPLPVIGIPLKAGALLGVDALYSTVQMPPGVPVATVGIDNAKNAGLLAAQILATSDRNLARKLFDYKKSLTKKVEEKANRLTKADLSTYINEGTKNR
jgi:5-(carboxyamino)imidazole ribonucleotide mutase